MMSSEISEEDHELHGQQLRASERPAAYIEGEVHKGPPAHEKAPVDTGVDEGKGIDRGESEHGDEPGRPIFVEENLWKTEIVEEYPEGFPQAAAFINADPTFPIYRRFSRGRTRIILQLQAELMTLEKKLDYYDKELAKNKDTERVLWQSGWRPSKSKEVPLELWSDQIDCYKRLNEALKLYDEAVIRDFKLRRLPTPSHHARRNVGRYFYQEKPLIEVENDHMTYVGDLIATGKGEKDNWLEGSISAALVSKPVQFFKRYFVSPEQRRRAMNNKYGESDLLRFVWFKRLETTADIIMVVAVLTLSLLPFYIFFNVSLNVVTVAFVSSLLSAFLLSSYAAVERPQLYIIAMSQSSLLVLGALISQGPK